MRIIKIKYFCWQWEIICIKNSNRSIIQLISNVFLLQNEKIVDLELLKFINYKIIIKIKREKLFDLLKLIEKNLSNNRFIAKYILFLLI
jgi:hypothetical protein